MVFILLSTVLQAVPLMMTALHTNQTVILLTENVNHVWKVICQLMNGWCICNSALKLIPGCTSNSQCNLHEPTCDTLTRTCYNCNHCKYYNCNSVGKRWMHKKCRDHSQLCLPGGLCVDRPKAGLQYLNNYLNISIKHVIHPPWLELFLDWTFYLEGFP